MRLFFVSLSLGILIAVAGFAATTLDVYFMDVGHGDAILIDCGDWEVLIDAGRGYSATSAGVLERCIEDGILELAILSHPHADHYGGFSAALQDYEVWEAWSSHDAVPDRCGLTYRAFSASVGAEGLVWTHLERGERRRTGCLAWTVLSPGEIKSMPIEDNDNDNSLVLLLEYGNAAFLFAGDIQTPSEKVISSIALPESFLVLKLPHHGSDSSSAIEFLEWADPELAIVSGNAGDLSAAVVANLGQRNVPFLTTFDNGTICVSTDGTAVWVRIVGAPADRGS